MQRKLDRVLINGSLTAILLLAVSGLVAYVPGFAMFGRVHPDYIPMAPTTSFSFLFLSIAVWVHGKPGAWPWMRSLCLMITVLVTLFGLLEVVGFYLGMDLNFENRLVPDFGMLGSVPIARMSPSTGALFFLSGIAWLCFFISKQPHNSANRYLRQSAGIFSSIGLISAGTFLLGYLYGTPFLYDQKTIPMAFTTAAGFGFLGIGGIASVGPVFFPLCHFSGESTQTRLMRVFVPLVFCAVIVQGLLTRLFPLSQSVNNAFSAAVLAVVCALLTAIAVNKVSKIVGQKIDFAEQVRKQAEEVVSKNEARVISILMASPNPMIIYTEKGTPEYLNKAFTEVFGWSMDELRGRRIPFVPEDQKEITDKKIKELLNTGIIVQFETKRLTRNSSTIDVIISASAIQDKNGRVVNLVVTLTDITEQNKMLARLKEESDNFKDVYYNAYSAISTIDGDKFVDCNSTLVKLLNARAKEEVLNTHPSKLSPEMQPDGRSSFEKANEMIGIAFEKGFNNFEWTHKKMTGEEFPVDVSLTRISFRGKPVLHCFWKDLSKEKIIIDNLNKAKEDAEVGARTKAEFLANMSHEIRTPMNGVIGMIDMLLDTELTEEQRDFALSVGTSADSLLMLINDILDFSKIEAGKLDMENINFDLRPTLESLSDVMAIKASEKGVEFACLIHDRVPCLLRGDPGRLRQVLTNLTGNAIKFVEKGEVSISVDLKEETDTLATLLFEVKDTGIGIPRDRFDRLFESFTQADSSMTRKYVGTGLGLTISKQLTELMGGRIGVESEEGKGSTFWFTIVLDKQPVSVQRDMMIPETIKGKNILVVDDHEINRLVFREYLKSWGCRFDEAQNANQGLAKLKNAVNMGDPFHIAILDMQMPEMTGESLGIIIKNDPVLKQTLLVMATSMGQRGDAHRLETIGFSAFITKPVKKAILFDCLRIVLGRGKKSSSEVQQQIITSFKVEETMGSGKQSDRHLKIILAEDNFMNQKVAKNMLGKMGHHVVIANNGCEAVEIFKNSDFDLILMDGQMPVMDGIEATRAIRKMEKASNADKVPIIAVTANAMKGDRERFIDAGMNDYISKPLKSRNLCEVINRVMRDC